MKLNLAQLLAATPADVKTVTAKWQNVWKYLVSILALHQLCDLNHFILYFVICKKRMFVLSTSGAVALILIYIYIYFCICSIYFNCVECLSQAFPVREQLSTVLYEGKPLAF